MSGPGYILVVDDEQFITEITKEWLDELVRLFQQQVNEITVYGVIIGFMGLIEFIWLTGLIKLIGVIDGVLVNLINQPAN